MTNIDTHLVKAIVDMAIFLEFSGPDILNEDAAVEALERLSSELCELPEVDRKSLVEQILSLSTSYGLERREFVGSLPEFLGLV